MKRTLLMLGLLSALMLLMTGAGPPGETVDGRDLPRGAATYYQGEDGKVVVDDDVVVTREPDGAITMSSSSWTCTIYVSDPSQSGLDIDGNGWQYCWGPDVLQTRIRIAIQKHGWGPFWNNISRRLDTDWQDTNFLSRGHTGLCQSGTNTYRVVLDGFVRHTGGTASASVQSLNYLTVTC